MFFSAHIFFALERGGAEADPWRAMGAVLPDSAFTGTIGWPDLHKEAGARALGRVLGTDASSRHLVAGVLDHITLDDRSHLAFGGDDEGYSFSHQTPELVRLAARASQVQDDQVARGLAHNFIESAVDIHLLTAHPEFQDRARRVLKSVDLDVLEEGLAKQFERDKTETREQLSTFVQLATGYDLAHVSGWADCWMELVRLLLRYDGDKSAASLALELAVRLTAGDWRRVLE
jgi:hypothetical protein